MSFLLSVIAILFSSVVHAQDYCYSSADCSIGTTCSTEQGECLAPPNCIGVCPSVCAGICEQNSSDSPIQLKAPLELNEVFITTTCPNGCPQLLWLKFIEGISQRLTVGANISLVLSQYDTDTKVYTDLLSAATPLTSPDGTIDSFSIQLPLISPLQTFPVHNYYKLTVVYNLQEYTWFIKVTQKSLQHSPTATRSTLNPTTEQIENIIAPAIETIPVTQPGTYFPDLQAGSLVRVAAFNLSARAIISGYPDGTFGPLRLVNRAEAAKFLLNSRYKNLTVKPGSTVFPDIEPNAWYEPYIKFASTNNIITGYPNGLFRPANPVNTAEFLKMLTLTFDLPLDLPTEYIDVKNTDWFAQFAGIAEYYDLFPKRPSYVLYPSMELTREEVAIAINALITALENE